jgi:hypothetical protein
MLLRNVMIVLLAAMGASGLWNMIHEWPGAETIPQHIVHVGQFLFGAGGIGAAAALAFRPRLAMVPGWAWALGTSFGGPVAVVAYGGEPAFSFPSIAALLASVAIAWLGLAGIRRSVNDLRPTPV